MTDTAEQNRQQWRLLVEQWSQTNLSAAEWCRQHQIRYELFLYYRQRFKKQTPFREITDSGLDPAISVQIQGATVRIEKAFDPATLRQVVQALIHARTRACNHLSQMSEAAR